MIIFKDIITSDEVFADTYPFKIVDDVLFEVQGKMMKKVVENNFNIGANPSENPEEEKDEDLDTNAGGELIDIVDNHRLVEIPLDKAYYTGYIKSYMKKILDKLKADKSDRLEAFQKAAPGAVKNILKKFNDCKYFVGESMDSDNGMIILCDFKENVPYLYFWKDGLVGEKV